MQPWQAINIYMLICKVYMQERLCFSETRLQSTASPSQGDLEGYYTFVRRIRLTLSRQEAESQR